MSYAANKSKNKDPEKRAAKRRAQKEAKARGAMPVDQRVRVMSQSQANHASSGKARKWAAEGAEKLGMKV